MIATRYSSQSVVRRGKGAATINVSSQAALVALDGYIRYGSSKRQPEVLAQEIREFF
jgi:L-xylulose reductase